MKSNLLKKVPKVGTLGRWVGAGATIKIYSSWAKKLFSSCVVTFLSISSAHALSSPGCNLSWNWIFLSTFKAHLLGCFLRHFSCKEKRLTKSIQTSTSVFFCPAFFFAQQSNLWHKSVIFQISLRLHHPILSHPTYTILHIPSDPTNSTTVRHQSQIYLMNIPNETLSDKKVTFARHFNLDPLHASMILYEPFRSFVDPFIYVNPRNTRCMFSFFLLYSHQVPGVQSVFKTNWARDGLLTNQPTLFTNAM